MPVCVTPLSEPLENGEVGEAKPLSYSSDVQVILNWNPFCGKAFLVGHFTDRYCKQTHGIWLEDLHNLFHILLKYVQVTTLGNGLKVASVDRASPTSRIGLFFKSGSRHESLQNSGISHVLRAGAFLVSSVDISLQWITRFS